MLEVVPPGGMQREIEGDGDMPRNQCANESEPTKQWALQKGGDFFFARQTQEWRQAIMGNRPRQTTDQWKFGRAQEQQRRGDDEEKQMLNHVN
jgi:hypothetical protein